MNADGSGVTQLTHNSAYDGQLEWSPDGQRIVFHSNRDGDDEIYLMNPDGTGITKLTDNTAEDSAASLGSNDDSIEPIAETRRHTRQL